MPELNLVPISEAAERSGFHVATLYRYIASGDLKRYRRKGDRRTYVDLDAIMELKRLREVPPRDR